MTLNEANNRASNLAVIATVAVLGIGFAPELFREPEWLYKIDEFIMLALAIGALVWYFSGANRYRVSIAPVLFAVGLVGAKVLGIVLEIKDPEDVGDDFGAIAVVVLALGFAVWQYVAARSRAKAAPSASPAPGRGQ